jgi:pyrroline-5-carboxylate reductase
LSARDPFDDQHGAGAGGTTQLACCFGTIWAAVTATIAAYFAFIERIGSWLAQHGIPESKARDYIAQMFWGLTASAVDAPERSFQSLAGNHATAGGINEQFLRYLIEHGLLTNVSEALDAVLSRISAPSQSSDVGTAH